MLEAWKLKRACLTSLIGIIIHPIRKLHLQMRDPHLQPPQQLSAPPQPHTRCFIHCRTSRDYSFKEFGCTRSRLPARIRIDAAIMAHGNACPKCGTATAEGTKSCDACGSVRSSSAFHVNLGGSRSPGLSRLNLCAGCMLQEKTTKDGIGPRGS